MLTAFPASSADPDSLARAAWVDLLDPTPEESAAFEQAFGLRVPTKEQVAEIESTSRLRTEHDALYMTAPLLYAADDQPWTLAPAGFVLARRVLLTVRSAQLVAFHTVTKEVEGAAHVEPQQVFVRLLESSIDRMADLLEATGRDLDDASHHIFQPESPREARLSRETLKLRRLMIHTGRVSERMSRIHYTLVCLDRMAKFTVERGRDWLATDTVHRLQTACSDITSLVQFTEGLVARVQLLQDAASGIINIDQNQVIKVLTIASIVGIPPVLIAGIYGMNFKGMPEYDWAWGYPYALTLIAVSALLPLIWFKWKDWI
jgi:magnesium transporter